MDKSSEITKLAGMIKDIRIAMLTTREGDVLRSRPMGTTEIEADGAIWFFTTRHSAKTEEIEETSSVNISYMDKDKELYVSVSGVARVVEDKNKINELWNPYLKAWFPNGKEDPNIALLKVDVVQAEYWDAPDSKMVQLIGMVKAAVTGRPYDAGKHEKIQL